jgi:saccharopine dehydrogenase-like NADP-dependent oxidoreductase
VEKPRACLVGYGRVGSVTAARLKEKGFEVVVYDGSGGRVEAARAAGFEAYLADAAGKASERIASSCGIIATALPSSVAEPTVKALIRAGARKIVDVSYVKDPYCYESLALEHGSTVFVDAGVAPGFTKELNHVILNHNTILYHEILVLPVWK